MDITITAGNMYDVEQAILKAFALIEVLGYKKCSCVINVTHQKPYKFIFLGLEK